MLRYGERPIAQPKPGHLPDKRKENSPNHCQHMGATEKYQPAITHVNNGHPAETEPAGRQVSKSDRKVYAADQLAAVRLRCLAIQYQRVRMV